MGLISGIGRLLTVVVGILILLLAVLGLLNIALTVPGAAYINLWSIQGIVGVVITIVIGAVLTGIGLQTIDIDETATEGIVVIILALIIGNSIALIGGILILIGGLLES